MPETLPSGSYVGSCLKTIDGDGLRFLEHYCEPGSVVEEHDHAEAYFCLVLRGIGVERTGSTVREERPGCLTYQPPGFRHSGHWGPQPGKTFTVELGRSRADELKELGLNPEEPARIKGQAIDLCHRMAAELRQADRWSETVLDCLFQEMAFEIARRQGPALSSGWLKKLLQLLEEDETGELSLNDLASNIGIHPTHMARAFRSRCGSTIGEYRRAVRMRDAYRLLETELPLGEVAIELGYSDQSHFTAAFRRVARITPGTYRRLAKR
jgi:AraC family transcriptional regulator